MHRTGQARNGRLVINNIRKEGFENFINHINKTKIAGRNSNCFLKEQAVL